MVKFRGNPYSGNPTVPCGRADGETLTKLIVAFRSFAKALKKGLYGNEITDDERADTIIFFFNKPKSYSFI